MYIVNLYSKSLDKQESDIQLIELEIDAVNEFVAANKAIDYYYREKWSNAEWRKDEFELEMKSFNAKIKEFSKNTLLGFIPNTDIIINEYQSFLRKHLGSSDKSISEFNSLDNISSKIDYLYEIGCDLQYFVYPKKTKFEKIVIS